MRSAGRRARAAGAAVACLLALLVCTGAFNIRIIEATTRLLSSDSVDQSHGSSDALDVLVALAEALPNIANGVVVGYYKQFGIDVVENGYVFKETCYDSRDAVFEAFEDDYEKKLAKELGPYTRRYPTLKKEIMTIDKFDGEYFYKETCFPSIHAVLREIKQAGGYKPPLRKLGQTCLRDVDCRSRNYHKFHCSPRSGKQRLLQNGEKCAIDGDCAGRRCSGWLPRVCR